MVLIKGTTLIDALKSLRERAGDAGYQKLISLLSDEARKVFQGRILGNEWYSLDVFCNFLETDLKFSFDNDPNHLIQHSERVVEKQLSGIYRLFIKLGSPEFILTRAVTINKTYFQNVEMIVNKVAPGTFVVSYKGFTKNHRLMEYIIIGFFKKALELSGAKNVRTTFTVPIAEEKEFSEITISWLTK